jgi:hypothetical protein
MLSCKQNKILEKIKYHLDVETQWTYRYHLLHSIKQSNRLIVLAIKSYIHGVFPNLYASDGPVGIYKIYKEIRNIQHVKKLFDGCESKN